MKRFLRSKLILSLAAIVMIAAAVAIPLLSGSITRSHAAPLVPIPPGIPPGAGNLWVTGHDADLHCSTSNPSPGSGCNYLKIAVNFVVHGSTLPILSLDHGSQVSTAISFAFGSSAPTVKTVDPRTGFASLPLLNSTGKPLYSAIIVASDTTCGGCDNNEISSTPDSDAINARTADIAKFFDAGGGILALTGAEHRSVYYNFLPVPVTPLAVTPLPGALGNPGVFTFFKLPGVAIGIGQSLGLTNSDINCCITHNSFVPISDGSLSIIELDGAHDPVTGSGNAITLIGIPQTGPITDQKQAYLQNAEEEFGFGLIFGLPFKFCKGVAKPICFGLSKILGAPFNKKADEYLKLAADPPDPNFMVIAQPTVPPIPKVSTADGFTNSEVQALNALSSNIVHQSAFGDVLLTSINRASGAFVLGSKVWEARQLQAARKYAAHLAELLEAEPGLLNNVEEALEAANFPTLHITSTGVSAIQSNIAANGLPAQEVKQLQKLGASSTDINQIQQNLIALDPNAVAALGGGIFPHLLIDQSLTNAILGAAIALEQFAGCDNVGSGEDCN